MTRIIDTPAGYVGSINVYSRVAGGFITEELPPLGQTDIEGDYLVAILEDYVGGVFEYLFASTPVDTVRNFATDAHTIRLLAGDDSDTARAIRHEVGLYNDCFGLASI